MLSNAYFLANFRFDTAENEPAKNLQNLAKFANFADPNPLTLALTLTKEARRWQGGLLAAEAREEAGREAQALRRLRGPTVQRTTKEPSRVNQIYWSIIAAEISCRIHRRIA